MIQYPRAVALVAMLIGTMAAAQQPRVDAVSVTVEADNKPLTDVLGDLADQVGVGLIVQGTDLERVTLALNKVSFADCVSILADMFGLLMTWEDGALVARPVEHALAGVDKQLREGKTDLLLSLRPLAQGKVPIYGSDELRRSLADGVSRLVESRVSETLVNQEPDPELARALADLHADDPQTGVPLFCRAIQAYLGQGRTDEALALWFSRPAGNTSSQVTWTWGALLAELHYSGSPLAAEFWARTFSTARATLILQEGWRQSEYQDALEFARLNLAYALGTGRQLEADQLQAEIDGCLQSTRVVQVVCAIDQEAFSDPRSEAKVRARVARLSEVYQKAFGISFCVADVIAWDPPSDSNFRHQYTALKRSLGLRKPELTLGFILEVFEMHPGDFDPGHAHLWTGYGCPHMGAYLLTRDFSFEYVTEFEALEWTFSAGKVAETLVHEMGHMFGALHVDDLTSVMRPTPKDQPVFDFDEANARVIFSQKWKDFSRGAESLGEVELLDLLDGYQRLAEMSQRPNGAAEELARTHLALAKLYRRRGQLDYSDRHLGSVIQIGVPNDIVTEAQRMYAR